MSLMMHRGTYRNTSYSPTLRWMSNIRTRKANTTPGNYPIGALPLSNPIRASAPTTPTTATRTTIVAQEPKIMRFLRRLSGSSSSLSFIEKQIIAIVSITPVAERIKYVDPVFFVGFSCEAYNSA